MPIDLPALDDRTFDELLDEGRRRIPAYAPSWTDHNTSDPGVTFIELFAATTELLIYRINRISDASKRAFLKLLAPQWTPTAGLTVDQELSAAIRALRREARAVTPQDYARLAREADTRVLRAACLPRRNLDGIAASAATTDAPGHDSVVIVCGKGDPVAEVRQIVQTDLAGRVLLGTAVHVAEPAMLRVAVKLKVYAYPDHREDDVRARVLNALESYFDPRIGGPARTGWPFGAPIYRSDVYALVERLEGVDWVQVNAPDDVFVVTAVGDRRMPAGATNATFVGLALNPNELVAFDRTATTIDVPSPSGTA